MFAALAFLSMTPMIEDDLLRKIIETDTGVFELKQSIQNQKLQMARMEKSYTEERFKKAIGAEREKLAKLEKLLEARRKNLMARRDQFQPNILTYYLKIQARTDTQKAKR